MAILNIAYSVDIGKFPYPRQDDHDDDEKNNEVSQMAKKDWLVY